MRLDEAVEVLESTPAVLRALLGGLSEGWTRHEPDPGWWSANEVLGHFIHTEEVDWIPRIRMILEHGEDRPFDPLDRGGGIDEAMRESTSDLLGRFEELRRENVAVLRSTVSEESLAARGLHPRFGPVTMGQLVATWAAHDLNHLGQVTEALAKRYREEVGPWRAFLPILNRPMEDSGG